MNKRHKWAAFLLISIVTIITIGFLAAPIANSFTKKLIKAELDKLEELSLDSFSVSLLSRKICFYKVEYHPLQKPFSACVEEIEIKGISYRKLLLNKELVINHLIIREPQVNYQVIDSINTENKKTVKKGKLNSILIKNLLLTEGYAVSSKDSTPINQFHGIQINLKELFIENLNQVSITTIKYRDFNLRMDSSFLSQNANHLLKTNKIQIDQTDGIKIEQLALYPNEVYRSGAKKDIHRVNWTNIVIDSLKLNVDWNKLIKNKTLISNQVQIHQLNYNSIIDKNYPRKEFKEKPMLNQLLQSIELPITIDSLQLNNSRFQYSERKKGGTDLGQVYFTNFNGVITNISNNRLQLTKNSTLTAKVETKLMGASKLSVRIKYDLNSKTENHQISGNIKDFDLRKLNAVFLPLALVKFKSGRLKELTFNYYLNDTESEGNLKFYYKDLKVIIFKDKHIFKPELLGKLETALANSVFIRSENPLRGNFVDGTVEFKREKEKSFLTFWWKSLFSGMESTIMRQK